jgi:hypothetical protein
LCSKGKNNIKDKARRVTKKQKIKKSRTKISKKQE